MAEIGAFLTGDEHGACALMWQAHTAEVGGMPSVLIAEHFHQRVHDEKEGEDRASATRLFFFDADDLAPHLGS